MEPTRNNSRGGRRDGAGRPAKDTKRRVVYMCDDEWQRLRTLARAKGVPIGEYVAQLI